MKITKHPSLKLTRLLLLPALASALQGHAAQAAVTQGSAGLGSQDILRYALAGIMVLLLLVILVLGNAVIGAGKLYSEKERKNGNTLIKSLLLPVLMGIAATAHAEDATVSTGATTSWIPADIVIMILFLCIEFLVIFVLARMLQQFLRPQAPAPAKQAAKVICRKQWFQKMNQTVAVEEEHTLDLNHDYDGIRELDNKIPSWWRYAFYATMAFSVVYLYRMFVSETLPDQIRELQAANEIAALQKAEYLKNAANNVDENNVTLLDATGIAEGSVLFSKNCLACHGDKGQGGVGPNLTDDYWLHSGGLKDIFKSIKYGWPDKGMKAWKDDFSPVQIAQLSSYVKSLQGSNPPAAKEPQGTLYTEAATAGSQQDTVTSTSL